MVHHLFKTVWRRLKSEKGFTLINILGLGVGLACGIMVLVYVRYNRGFDRFHADAGRIYRVISNGLFIDYDIHQTGTPSILAETLRRDHAEEFLVTQVQSFRSRLGTPVVQVEGRSFFDARLCIADSDFLKVFSFPLLAGGRESVLRDPQTAVLTRSTAAKYFGARDPLGETLLIDETPYRVTGLIEDVPARSHIQFDGLLFTKDQRSQYNKENWLNNNYSTYVRLREGASEARLAGVLGGLVKQHIAPRLKTGNWWAYDLEPLLGIHLHSDLPAPYGVNGNASSVTIISLVAVLILLIAGANFVNLTTARLARRSKDVGVRKVVGSGKRLIIFEFLGEAVLLCCAGLVLALALSAALLPALSRLVGQPLSFGPASGSVLMGAILGGPWIVGLLAGLYPALSLASYSPVATIRGVSPGGRRKSFLRNALVVFQFTVSIFLFIATGVLAGQLRFLQEKNLGFDREHVLVVRNTGLLGARSRAFKNELRSRTDVLGAAGTSALPGTRVSNWAVVPEGLAATTLDFFTSDPDLQDVLKLRTVQGRFLAADRADRGSIVLNEEAVRRFGWPDPVGKRIEASGEMMTVVGVVRDFHYQSLHSQMEPLGIRLLTEESDRARSASLIAVRIAPGRLPDTIDGIRGTWEKCLPGVPFNYTFLDDDYDRLYSGERRTAAMSTVSTGLAILVSSLGLLGLAAYSAESRRKEISIRKVLGATAGRIVSLFSRELLKWVLLANLLAWPIAYWAMGAWLSGFAYRIGLEARFFLIAAAGALAIALLVVGGQTLRAAM
ncbi:MAG: ABC transporter permease, partial [Candidatus Aminicenantes bacterium]|nr:ABC transporter permease [Candidatus Aminicenantes bacterium]